VRVNPHHDQPTRILPLLCREISPHGLRAGAEGRYDAAVMDRMPPVSARWRLTAARTATDGAGGHSRRFASPPSILNRVLLFQGQRRAHEPPLQLLASAPSRGWSRGAPPSDPVNPSWHCRVHEFAGSLSCLCSSPSPGSTREEVYCWTSRSESRISTTSSRESASRSLRITSEENSGSAGSESSTIATGSSQVRLRFVYSPYF
jgi:hypothetical protein